MKKLHLMVLKAYLGPLVMTFFIAVFILLMQFLWLYVDDFIGKGLGLGLLFELMFYTSWTLVPLALPISVLLSSLMTMGNMGEHYELAAAKTSGISLWKLMQPLIITAIFLSGVAFYFSNYLYPLANLKHQSLLFDVRKKKMAFNLEEGSFYHDIDSYVMRVESKGLDNSTIYGVMIYDHSDHLGLTKVTVADWGVISMSPDEKSVIFELHDGCNYEESAQHENYQSQRQMQRLFFKKQIVQFSLESFQMDRTNEDLFKSNYSMQNISQLNYSIDSLNRSIDDKQKETCRIFKEKYALFTFPDSLAMDLDTEEAVSTETTNHKKSMHLSKIKKNVQNSPKKYSNQPNCRQEIDTLLTPSSDFLENFSQKDRKQLINSAMTMARNHKQTMEYFSKEILNLEESVRRHEVAWHEKFTLSFACLVMFFIGAPLGAIIRKGGLGFSLVISTLLFIVFYVMNMIGKEYALAGEMTLWMGMWFSSFLFLPLGIFFTLKAANDSPLFDLDAWEKSWGKLSKRWKKR